MVSTGPEVGTTSSPVTSSAVINVACMILHCYPPLCICHPHSSSPDSRRLPQNFSPTRNQDLSLSLPHKLPVAIAGIHSLSLSRESAAGPGCCCFVQPHHTVKQPVAKLPSVTCATSDPASWPERRGHGYPTWPTWGLPFLESPT